MNSSSNVFRCCLTVRWAPGHPSPSPSAPCRTSGWPWWEEVLSAFRTLSGHLAALPDKTCQAGWNKSLVIVASCFPTDTKTSGHVRFICWPGFNIWCFAASAELAQGNVVVHHHELLILSSALRKATSCLIKKDMMKIFNSFIYIDNQYMGSIYQSLQNVQDYMVQQEEHSVPCESQRQTFIRHIRSIVPGFSYLTSPSDTATMRASSKCGQLTNTDFPSTSKATSSHT